MDVVRGVANTVAWPLGLVQGIVAAPSRIRKMSHTAQAAGVETLDLLLRVRGIVQRVEVVLDQVTVVVSRADDVARAAGAVAVSAASVANEAAAAADRIVAETRRLRRLLDLYEPQLNALAPLVTAAAADLGPQQLRSVVQALDLVPELVDLVQPALRNLADLSPELEQLTERMDDVGQIVQGIPGANLLRQRARSAEDED